MWGESGNGLEKPAFMKKAIGRGMSLLLKKAIPLASPTKATSRNWEKTGVALVVLKDDMTNPHIQKVGWYVRTDGSDDPVRIPRQT